MTDIVERLRAVSAAFLNPDGDLVEALLQSDRDDVAAEAADEIETLRAKLREAEDDSGALAHGREYEERLRHRREARDKDLS